MIPVVRDRRLADQPAVAGPGHALEHLGAMRERRGFTRGGRRIELPIDLRHRIAVAVLRRGIERQPAVGRRMRVVIGTQAHRAALQRARSPVVEQLVAEQQPAVGAAQPRFLAGGAFPHARVVADERLVRRAAEVLARDQAVRHVLAGKRLLVDRRLRGDELVAVHVAADESGSIREPVREPRVRGEQQQVRAPALARGEHEHPRAILRDLVRTILVIPLRRRNGVAAVGEHKLAHQHPIVQRHLLRRDQLLIGVVRRISRAGRAHVAAGVVEAAGASAAEGLVDVARQRQRREFQSALLGPFLEDLQVVGQRHRRLRIRPGAAIFGIRARIARDVQAAFGFHIKALELVPLDRPVFGESVDRLQPQIFLGEPVARATPMQRLPAHRHRHRDHALGLLILDVVVVPRVFAVLERAPMIGAAVLAIEDRAARFNDGDAQSRFQLGEPLNEHRGGDAAADHADVGFVNRHRCGEG